MQSTLKVDNPRVRSPMKMQIVYPRERRALGHYFMVIGSALKRTAYLRRDLVFHLLRSSVL